MMITMKKKTMIALIAACLLLVSVSDASAITISPSIISPGELERGGTYQYYVYLTNQDTEAVSMTLEITPRSKYLEEFVAIDPKELTLSSGETKKISISITIPNESVRLSNGTHALTILPNIIADKESGMKILSSSIIAVQFTVPGTVIEMMILDSFNAPDVKKGETMTFELSGKNVGNTRSSAFPFVDIQRYGSEIGHSQGYTEYLVEAGRSARMFTKYTTANLEPGKYKAIAYIEYADKRRTTSIEKTFSIIADNVDKGSPDTEETSASSKPAVKAYPALNTERNTINIGGQKNNGITDQQTEPETAGETSGELLIRKLSIGASGRVLEIQLEIENTGAIDLDYDLVFSIFSGSGKEGIIISSGTITERETAEIIKIWNASRSGNYTVDAELTYMKGDGTKETVAKSTSINIDGNGVSNSITGELLRNISPGKAAAIIIALIALVVIALWIKNRRKPQKLKNLSDIYRKKDALKDAVKKQEGNSK